MRIIFIFFIVLIICSCKRKTPNYYTTDHGLKYKFHDISSIDKQPNRGDYLSVYMTWKTLNDSIFYDSKKQSPSGIDIIKLGKAKHLGGIEEGFYKLREGDSASFYIQPKRFYKDYLNLNRLPKLLDHELEIVITIRLLTIQNEKEYRDHQKSEKEILELKELEQISKTIKKWRSKYDSVIELNGSYVVLFSAKDTTKLRTGNVFELDYTASFINGTEFYSTYKNGFPDEFQMGKDAQLVKGLRHALSKMHYNQKAKVLVPSYQGFGEKGSPGKIIPPFTPIIYELNVRKKKPQ